MNILPDLNATRVLVVEDNLRLADRIVEVLRRAGYFVQNAYNSGDAFAADHSRFTLAVVDAAMHDRDGARILDNIAHHPTFKRLPILVVADDGGAANGSIGNGKVLHYPFNDDDLLSQITLVSSQERQASVEPSALSQAQTSESTVTDDTAVNAANTAEETSQPVIDSHLQQQLAELRTLSNLARSISSVLELGEVLNEIVEAATALTDAEEGLLLLPDDEGKALYMRAMKGVDDDSARNFRIKIEDPLVGRVYMSGAPVLIGDRGLQRVKTEYFVKSLLYVPMTYKGRTMGVLGVNNRTAARAFTPHDVELLRDLAAHAAIAIENARLYEESQQQNQQLTRLVEAAHAVNATLALNDVVASVCQQVIQTLEMSGCLISRHDPKTGTLHPLARARRVVRRAESRTVMPLDERPVLKQALEQNAFYIVKRGVNDINWRLEHQHMERDGVDRLVVIPVRPGQQPPIGSLELFYYGEGVEVTSEFRARIRAIALEILVLLRDKAASTSNSVVFTSAQKILDESGAHWMRLSLIQEKQKLATMVDYGARIYREDLPRPKLLFPQSMSAFSDQAPLQYHTREPKLPDGLRTAMQNYGAESLLSLPLYIKGKPFGAMTIYNAQEARNFRPNEISLAWALVAQGVTAIENANLYSDLGQSLSDLRHAQAQLVQAARLSTMGELAAVVAHQINNPLTTIMGDAELILQEMDKSNPWHDGVTAIYRAGKRAHAVVKRLLSTARRGNPAEPLQRIDAHETIFNTLELVTTHIERNNIRFDVSLDTGTKVFVFAAPGHLEDLWLNLLLNARDALVNASDAMITIRSRCMDTTLEVTIGDNGPGIPPQHIEHVFDAFFTTKPAGEGTGLGLYICKQIVEQCRGTIRVEPARPRGTCFVISLPVMPQAS